MFRASSYILSPFVAPAIGGATVAFSAASSAISIPGESANCGGIFSAMASGNGGVNCFNSLAFSYLRMGECRNLKSFRLRLGLNTVKTFSNLSSLFSLHTIFSAVVGSIFLFSSIIVAGFLLVSATVFVRYVILSPFRFSSDSGREIFRQTLPWCCVFHVVFIPEVFSSRRPSSLQFHKLYGGTPCLLYRTSMRQSGPICVGNPNETSHLTHQETIKPHSVPISQNAAQVHQ